MNNQRTTSPL